MQNLHNGWTFLADNGLNLAAVFACDELPADILSLLSEHDIETAQYRRLVLLGHGGRRFWEAFARNAPAAVDPIDAYSIGVAARFIDAYLTPSDWHLLYPGPMLLPLQRLGELAGWCHPSPLGTGISNEFGLWFAYRVAFVTTADLPPRVGQVGPSPCETCATRDCVAACPSQAVRWGNAPNIDRCVSFRLESASPCAASCLARLACPVAVEHRYTANQMAYHYGHSLAAIRSQLATGTD